MSQGKTRLSTPPSACKRVQKIIKTVKCRGYAFCGELGDESPAEVTGVATLEVMVKGISMKQS